MSRTVSSGAPFRAPVTFDLQGHRGARGLYPENALEGFLLALRLGVTTLEMDVVVTRDRELVVSHDPWFSSEFSALPSGERISPASQYDHRIFDMTYETVAGYDCGRPNPRFPGQKEVRAVKPRLSAVLAGADAYAAENEWPPVRFNIETKTRPEGDDLLHPPPLEVVDLLLEVLAAAGASPRTTIQSFDPRTLRIVRSRDPSIATSLLVARSDFLGPDADIQILGFEPSVYSPDHRLVTQTVIDGVHDRGIRIIPWTINDPSRAIWLAQRGVDGLITDFPDIVGAALGIPVRDTPSGPAPPRFG